MTDASRLSIHDYMASPLLTAERRESIASGHERLRETDALRALSDALTDSLPGAQVDD